jgi:hypothetical protein
VSRTLSASNGEEAAHRIADERSLCSEHRRSVFEPGRVALTTHVSSQLCSTTFGNNHEQTIFRLSTRRCSRCSIHLLTRRRSLQSARSKAELCTGHDRKSRKQYVGLPSAHVDRRTAKRSDRERSPTETALPPWLGGAMGIRRLGLQRVTNCANSGERPNAQPDAKADVRTGQIAEDGKRSMGLQNTRHRIEAAHRVIVVAPSGTESARSCQQIASHASTKRHPRDASSHFCDTQTATFANAAGFAMPRCAFSHNPSKSVLIVSGTP